MINEIYHRFVEDGDYYAWGLGEMWQFGNVERDVKLTPVLVSHKGLKFKDLALGGVSVLGLTGMLDIIRSYPDWPMLMSSLSR